jgi:hypothetical protein
MSGPFQRIVRRGGDRPDPSSAPAQGDANDAPTEQFSAVQPPVTETNMAAHAPESGAPADPPVDVPNASTPTAAVPASADAPSAADSEATTAVPAPAPAGEPASADAASPTDSMAVPEPTATVPPPTDATIAAPAAAPAPPAAQATELLPAVPPAERRPGFRERGRMRRRLRYLRKLRELQVRDLGGLAFDLRRFERKRDDLITQKIDQIRACDDELRALERALDERRDVRDVREPGIGGTCPRCFAIHGSTDRFCASCGAALGGAVQGPAQQVRPTPPAASQPPSATPQ